MRPVGAVDQAFLWLERRNQPMHVGGLMLLTPPPDAGPDYVQQLAEQARAATKPSPPFNQRLERHLGMWFWEEDREFDLEAHFRHLTLPKPGRIRELLALISQLHSNLLDRAKPMWEAYLIDGVEGGRLALYVKIHHAIVDGVAASRLLQRAMSEDPDDREVPPPWMVRPRSSDGMVAPIVTSAMTEMVTGVRKQMAAIPGVVRELVETLGGQRKNPDFVSPWAAPRSILNQRVTGSRRFAAQSWDLARIKGIGKQHGATLNDVVLSMCGSALRRYLGDQNALPDKPLVAMVPVSLRRDDSETGNQVALALANLGTDIADPRERLEVVARSIGLSKERYARMSPAEIMGYVGTLMGPSGLNMAVGLAPRWQAFNIVISNVPGPKRQLYYNGARVDGMYPVSIVLDGQALNITMTSYVDKLEVGLIACRRTLPHMQKLLGHLEEGLRELE